MRVYKVMFSIIPPQFFAISKRTGIFFFFFGDQILEEIWLHFKLSDLFNNHKMRSFIVLQLAIIFIVGSNFENAEAKMTIAQVTNALKPMRKQCIGKVPVNPELLDAIVAGADLPEDPDLQCYYACFLKAMKVFKDGKVLPESMIKQVDMMLPADEKSARMKEVLGICAAQATSEDPCVHAWQFMKCLYETDRAICFFP